MTIATYISFFVLVFTVVYSPGPMTMFMMAHGMKMQYSKIWPVLIGANNAYLISILIFTVGLTQILQQYVMVFKWIQIAGITYLLYRAYILWNKEAFCSTATVIHEIPTSSSLYIKGALIALSNPKAIVLFSLVFPQFISESENYLLQIAVFGMTFLVLQFSSGCIYAYLGQSVKKLIEQSSSRNLINKISAVVFVIVAYILLRKL